MSRFLRSRRRICEGQVLFAAFLPADRCTKPNPLPRPPVYYLHASLIFKRYDSMVGGIARLLLIDLDRGEFDGTLEAEYQGRGRADEGRH